MFRSTLVVALSALSLYAAADTPTIKVVEEIAAKVNGDIITRGELEKKRLEIEAAARRPGLTGQEVVRTISVPEADLQKYYTEHNAEFVRQEQVFLSQIVISTEGKTPAQAAAAEAKAKDLVARARNGEKFSDMARDNSDDETGRSGGYIGAVPRGQMD